MQEQIVLFMRAATSGQLADAKHILTQRPEIAQQRLQVACAAADIIHVNALLAGDATLASRVGAGRELPLICTCASHFHHIGPAVAAASVQCVQALLDAGADPNARSVGAGSDELPALYFACVSNNLGVVKLLLERGAKPNDGESFYHAAEMNHRECLELLVAHGADPNAPLDELAATPLHRAAASGNAELATLLLEHGADPNLPRKDGKTPYVLAIRGGNARAVEALRAAGARPEGLSPADQILGACMVGEEWAARAILEKNPGLMSTLTAEDHRMIHHAIWTDRPETVRSMGALGFDVGATNHDGATPLHVAAWRGQVDVVKILLGLGAAVNVRDRRYGSSPVGWAANGSTVCRSADEEYCAVMSALIDAGADYATSVNNTGEPPMGSAAVHAHLVKRGFIPRAS